MAALRWATILRTGIFCYLYSLKFRARVQAGWPSHQILVLCRLISCMLLMSRYGSCSGDRTSSSCNFVTPYRLIHHSKPDYTPLQKTLQNANGSNHIKLTTGPCRTDKEHTSNDRTGCPFTPHRRRGRAAEKEARDQLFPMRLPAI